MPSIGWLELLLVFVAAMLIFGPKFLPDIGRELGKGVKEFKCGISDSGNLEKDEERKS